MIVFLTSLSFLVKWGVESYHHSRRVTDKESEDWNPIIILGGWPKKKVRSGILSSFLAGNPKRKWGQESYHNYWRGDQKTKWGQESYHHSWRLTQKENEIGNPIIIIGGLNKKEREVSNFLCYNISQKLICFSFRLTIYFYLPTPAFSFFKTFLKKRKIPLKIWNRVFFVFKKNSSV